MASKYKTGTSVDLLKKFSHFVSTHLGIHFKEDDLWSFEQKLIPMAAVLGESDLQECLSKLMRIPLSQESKAIIARYITIGETYFFRDQEMFKALEDNILPELLAKKTHSRELKIWSSACCTGEEIYSVAILLHRIVPLIAGWRLDLIGTDINTDFLHKAKTGIFTQWSLRGVSEGIKKKYFTPIDDRSFLLHPDIQKMCEFYPLNLAEESFGHLQPILKGSDIIFACNVLYYFSSSQRQSVIDRLQELLTEGGLLIVSPIEVPWISHSHLQEIHIKKNFLFKKKSHSSESLGVSRKLTLSVTPANYPKTEAKQPIPLNPSDALVQIQIYADEGKLEEALQLCLETLKNDPCNPLLYYLKSIIYQAQDKSDEAIKAVEQALFFDPSFIMAQFSLGNLLLAKGDKKNANRHFQIVLKLLKEISPLEIIPYSNELKGIDLDYLTRKTISD